MARLYESYDDDTGECRRAIYIGIILRTHLSPTGINPGADGIPESLDAMQEQLSINTNQDQCHSDQR